MINMEEEKSQARIVAEEALRNWMETDPDFPWHLTLALVEEVVDDEFVILLTNDQGREILEEQGLSIPQGFGLMDVVGRANPGLISARALLQTLRG